MAALDFWPPPPPWTVKKRPLSKRRKIDCRDCGIDTSFATGNGHTYTVNDDVWTAAGMAPKGELCLDCLQVRLKRPLVLDDFIRTPIEIAMSFVGKGELVEESLRARGRADLADKAARWRRQEEEWRAEMERHWQETRARHGWEA